MAAKRVSDADSCAEGPRSNPGEMFVNVQCLCLRGHFKYSTSRKSSREVGGRSTNGYWTDGKLRLYFNMQPLDPICRVADFKFTCRNCGGGDRGRVAIYRPFGEVSLSLNRTVTCMVLKANDRRTSCPCHDEFRGPRSDYVRQVALATTTVNSGV
ncbi:uncharacterized protein TNCV_2305031 [Trichonephila clavipes]|nr:uncharacterized protein TNCV_2305031 [Trichonephila clavipes]